ncbi:hypothetical protein LZ554_000806 [Drepanopeziza brunnea f. sp. 'monogermtubi']|nr:hypothetical protein LZ554_000806 [Drepanopeziza brunnea f. sp. 'monogermtubi']
MNNRTQRAEQHPKNKGMEPYKIPVAGSDVLPRTTKTDLSIPNQKLAKMCWMTETWYVSCNHWGSKRLETRCARGLSMESASGCWENTVNGVSRIEGALCERCVKRRQFRDGTPLAGSSGEMIGQKPIFPGRGVDDETFETGTTPTEEREMKPTARNTKWVAWRGFKTCE